MENNGESKYSVKNSELFNVWHEKYGENEKRAAIYAYFLSHIDESDCSENLNQCLEEQSRMFCANIKTKWSKSYRSLNNFNKQHAVWLKGNTSIKIDKVHPAPTKLKPGRPHTSDPFISSISLNKRIKKQKKLKLPTEVINLLKSYPISLENYQTDEEQSESEDEEIESSGLLNPCFLNIVDNLELENQIDKIKF